MHFCPSGEIGRHARLRILSEATHAGSSPVSGTILKNQGNSLIFYSSKPLRYIFWYKPCFDINWLWVPCSLISPFSIIKMLSAFFIVLSLCAIIKSVLFLLRSEMAFLILLSVNVSMSLVASSKYWNCLTANHWSSYCNKLFLAYT